MARKMYFRSICVYPRKSAVGALAALWIRGQPFGFMASLGIVSLVGVIKWEQVEDAPEATHAPAVIS